MLGRLAKYLRFLGYDALFTKEDDEILVARALRENRVLLTRDTGIMKRKIVKSGRVKGYLVESCSVYEQVGEVMKRFNLKKKEIPFCTLCNVPISLKDKEAVKGKVPPYVFKTKKVFGECPSCHRIYWRGTHWENFFAALSKEIDSEKVVVSSENNVPDKKIDKSEKESNDTEPS